MKENFYNLTNPQKSIWSIEQYYSGTNINNICGTLTIKETIDLDILNKAINIFIQNNSSFWLNFKIVNEDLLQFFNKPEKYIEFEKLNLKNYAEVKKIATTISEHIFNITDSSLYKFVLYKLENGNGGFIILIHHIISDAATLGMVSEIVDNYTKIIKNEENKIEKKDYSYKDYILSEKEYMNSNKFQKDKQYWNNLYSTIPEIASIPSSKNNKDLSFGKSKRIEYTIKKDLLNKIQNICKQNNISNFNFFIAIYAVYINKILNLEDFSIGTPILNRTNFNEKQTAGMFINTAALRINVNNNISFIELTKQIAQSSFSMLRSQKYPYEKLLKDLRKKQKDLPSLFDIMLSYQVTKANDRNIKTHYEIEWLPTSTISNGIYINLHDNNNEGNLKVAYDYQISKYQKMDIKNMHMRILHIINQVLENIDCLNKDIEIVTPQEKQKILYDFNNTKIEYPHNKTLINIFEEQVKKNPNNIAIIFENEKLTYKELNEKANQLAHYLLRLNIISNDKIAIYLPRHINTIISMLAIKKINCAYMLIEKSLPLNRIEYMLKDANVSFVITNKQLENKKIANSLLIENIPFKNLSKDNIKLKYLPENHLSVVYTSGSTGTPKGILVKNNSIVNLVLGYCHSMQAHTLSNFLSICSVSFDMFAAEIWIPILLGKKLILANEDESINPILISNLVNKYNIEFMLITPSKMNLLLSNNNKCLNHLKAIQIGGEVLSSQFYKKLIKYTNSKIYNGYGPSETTSCATCKLITSSKSITIGKPLPNIQTYICNKSENLCPTNIIGELCIAGDGVSYGYINKKELTQKNFIKNPFGNGFLYKTGDLAKFLPNGEIEFIGRNDNQIKIRGLRIELDEINKIIEQFPKIEKCITIVNKTNSICCYFIGKNINIENLKNYTNQKMPNYMVPSHFIQLKSFPLTLNGKLDINKLPDIEIDDIYIEPKTTTEIKLSKLWQKLLSLDKISITSNFFELGGDSLVAINLVTQISNTFKLNIKIKDIFTHSNIRDLANYIDSVKSQKIDNKILKVNKKNYYFTSSAQKRIYYSINKEGKNSTTYNISGGLIFDKIPNIKKLNKCFKRIIEKNEAFRTYFEIENNQIVQKILDNLDFNIEVEKSTNSNIENIAKNFIRPFDLSMAPLIRIKFIELKNGKGLLLMDMSHIIGDGATFKIILKQLSDLYNGKDIKNNQIDYKDFAEWENNNLNNHKYKEAENYWISQFKNEIPILEFPTNFTRSVTKSFEGSQILTTLDEEITKKINTICKENNITPFILLISIYYILLSIYSRTEDIVIGSPISGRYNEQMLDIVGMFVNTLPLRSKIDSKLSFKEFIEQIKEQVLTSFEYQNYPLDELIKNLNIDKSTNRNPLFDVLFTYQNDSYPKVTLGNINTTYYIPKVTTAKFDLSLEVIPEINNFKLRFEYCTKLFTDDFIQNFSEHYTNILKSVLENFKIKISDIDILSKKEKNQILQKFNDTKKDYPKNKTVTELFEKQVKTNHNKIALVFENYKLTYNELNKKANQLANYILENYKLKSHDVIGIFLDKSIESILAILAIIKIGCIYVPIDIDYPLERINYILDDSKAKLILTKKDCVNSLDMKISKICIDLNNDIYIKSNIENPLCNLTAQDLIYMMYTSGSTGKPKGVMIKHQNVVRLVKNTNYIEFSENERILQTGSIVFDACTFEIWGSFLNGGTLYLINKKNLLDQNYFEQYLKDNKITSIFLTTALFNQYCEASPTIFEKIKNLLTGGEAVSVKHMQLALKNFPKLNLIHVYGPTENTTFSTYYKVKEIKNNIIPIGKAIANSTAYVVSKDSQLLPVGVPGELWVSGDGLAKGYLNRDDLNKEKFIDNPFGKGKIYKTGDLVKLLDNGDIDFIGRIDNQVKIRGFRIELNEIDNTIHEYPYISKTYTVIKDIDEKKYIITYFTANRILNINDITLYLQEKLPFYMIPQFLIQLEDFPLNINGKIDKNLLPAPNLTTLHEYVAPENEIQKQLCDIWCKLFEMKKISILDNFFELGGDSLTAIKFQTEALKLDINLNYSDIFEYPTIKLLSEKKQDKEFFKADKNYNYSKFDKLLSINNIKNIDNKTTSTKCNNLLLCGATGFLGAHILDNYLTNTNGNIYCIVRKKTNVDSQIRLKNLLRFYFENKYDNYFGNRINVIYGDITLDNFGLSEKEYKKLGNTIDIMINSAAFVKHFGNFKMFQSINVIGTKNIIKFCKTFNKKLYHISTMSVGGITLQDENIKNDQERILFTEQNFYVGQNINNAYVYTKFEAEKAILEEIPNGLHACILRMGNISNRVSDGKFQINVSENAFINRIKSLLNIGVIQSKFLEHAVEFTPVDASAEAIIKIIENNPNFTVLHIFNTKVIDIPNLLAIIKTLGYIIEPVDDKTFSNTVKQFLKDDKLKSKISGLIPDLDSDKTMNLLSRTLQNGYFTTQYLNSIGYEWPEINKDYITKYIEYFKKIEYLD